MTEPKRRGRPPKAKPCAECGQAEGHYDDCPVGMGVALRHVGPPAEIVPIPSAVGEPVVVNLAQAYADRVWEGQSISADREWRVQRVKEALEAQGLSMEGVTLP